MRPRPPRLESTATTPAIASGACFGLYPASDFVMGDAAHADGVTFRQVRWYFQNEIVALPKASVLTVGLAKGMPPFAELAAWRARPRPGGLDAYPPVVWVAAPDVIAQAKIDPNGRRLLAAEGSWNIRLAQRLAQNGAYFDATTAAWFQQRPVRVRGRVTEHEVEIRMLWPKDFRLPLDARRGRGDPVPSTPEAVRALVREEPRAGATSPFTATLLWARESGAYAVPAGRAVVALILNGAQSDDDETHGGHFALVTGRTAADGSIAEWLVNNFYSLDEVSEKGIIAAPVPLDNYFGDLNSGQSYYRPSAMLVAVLAEDRAAIVLQAALNRIHAQFYRHQLPFHHASMNCAGISVDVLRTLGLPVPVRGPTLRSGAAFTLPWLVARERSLKKACALYDYVTEDQTRLLPAAAFEEVGAALARVLRRPVQAPRGSLAEWLGEDTEALFFLRLPQFPTTRPPGDAAIISPYEFHARVPDPAMMRTIPLAKRPLPAALRDDDLVRPPAPRSERVLRAWAALSVIGLPWALWRIARRRRPDTA